MYFHINSTWKCNFLYNIHEYIHLIKLIEHSFNMGVPKTASFLLDTTIFFETKHLVRVRKGDVSTPLRQMVHISMFSCKWLWAGQHCRLMNARYRVIPWATLCALTNPFQNRHAHNAPCHWRKHAIRWKMRRKRHAKTIARPKKPWMRTRNRDVGGPCARHNQFDPSSGHNGSEKMHRGV